MVNTRLSCRCLFVISGIVFFTFLMFYLITDEYGFHQHWYERPGRCVTPKHEIKDMVNLTFAVSDILKSFHVPHVLCYGSLWGALRIGRILPWDNNVDLCIMKDELDDGILDQIIKAFHSHNMKTTYSHRHGELVVEQNSAVCVISFFYLDSSNQAFKDGWENYLFSFIHRSSGSFPAILMEAPFPTIEFHGRPDMPIPHDDIELLKYLYKDDWWMEKPPLGCKGLNQ